MLNNYNEILQIGTALTSIDPNLLSSTMILAYLATYSKIKIKVSWVSGRFDFQLAFMWRSKDGNEQ